MDHVDIDQAFADGTLIDRAVARAALAARREYVRLGRSMPIWRDGRVVWIPPSELDVRDIEASQVEADSGGRSSTRSRM